MRLTLIRRGAKVPDDGSRWWQELPEGQTADGVRSVGYEVVEVVPLSEVEDALLEDAAVEALAKKRWERMGGRWHRVEDHRRVGLLRLAREDLAAVAAAFPSDSEEGQR